MSNVELLEIVIPTGDDWRAHAACKGRTRLFFAPKAERPQACAPHARCAPLVVTMPAAITSTASGAANPKRTATSPASPWLLRSGSAPVRPAEPLAPGT
jgi:hypothetical protein